MCGYVHYTCYSTSFRIVVSRITLGGEDNYGGLATTHPLRAMFINITPMPVKVRRTFNKAWSYIGEAYNKKDSIKRISSPSFYTFGGVISNIYASPLVDLRWSEAKASDVIILAALFQQVKHLIKIILCGTTMIPAYLILIVIACVSRNKVKVEVMDCLSCNLTIILNKVHTFCS